MTRSGGRPDPGGPPEPEDTGRGPFDASTDLGRAYLAVDWAATPLGDPLTWSDSLKSTVRLMLASRFAMWMGWGPQLTFFCNEAYRRDSLGGKYPSALGRPTGEVWSEIWDQLTDRVTAVTVAGESTWDEELRLFVQRSGYLEETFHTFSYSPLTAGDGTIVGLLCVVNEVTDGVVNARRIAAVSDLNARFATAATQRDVFDAAGSALTGYPAEFPFVAAYVQHDDDTVAELAWTCGLEPGHAATPPRLDLAAPRHPWAVAASAGHGGVVDDVDDLLADLPLDDQAGRPDRVVIAPVARGGDTGDGPVGFLVVAPSAHRPWDEGYASFVGLVAGQFGAALARARAFEVDRDQAHLIAAREHAIAVQLQSSLLPHHDAHVDHLDVASFHRAGVEGTAVGGDWYDVIDLGPGRTAFVIGDVMGRGVQAAAVMGQLRASVRAYARLELAPDVVLGLLDEAVRDLGPNKIVTCVYAVYDPADRTLVYANAGHLPPLLAHPDGTTVELPGGGPPLGAGRGWPTAETVTLPVGATLALYTDGVVERRGTDLGDGIAALGALLGASATSPLDDLPARLVGELMPGGSDDDIAVLVARVSGRADHDRSARLALDNQREHVATARAFVTDTLGRWDVDPDVVFDVELIVSELVTNAFLHAGTDVVLTLRAAHPRLFVEVHDDVPTSPQPRDALPSDTDGRGLAIVATLAARWGTRLTPHGKAVWCELPLSA